MAKKRGKSNKNNVTPKDKVVDRLSLENEENVKPKSETIKEELELREEDIVQEEGRDISSIKEEIKPEVIPLNDKVSEVIKKQSIFKRKKKQILFGVVLILAIAFVIVAINAMGLFVRRQSEIEMPLVYASNGELKYISSRKKSSVSVGKHDSDKIGLIRYPNRSDKYFLYSVDGELYLAYARSNKDAFKVAEDVKNYYFSANDKHIVYTDLDGNLYVHDFKKAEKLDNDISLVIEVTEDRVYYEKDGNLYSIGFKASKDDKIKIASDYYLASLNSDCSKILYAKETNDDEYEYHVYTIKNKKDQKVLSNVYVIYDYNDDFTEFIYGILNKDTSIDLNSFVDDDKKDYDSNFKVYSFDDYWNNKVDYDTYKNSQKDGEAVEDRNKIREELKNDSKNKLEGSETVNVYYQKGNKNIKLADSVSHVTYTDLKNKRLIFSKDDYSSIKKLKISDIDSISDVKNHVNSNLKNVVVFKAGENDGNEITSGKSVVTASIFGDDLYCEADNEIIYAKVNKYKLGEIKTIATESSAVDWENLYDGGLVFVSNIKDDRGDLNVVIDGKVTAIDTNVYEEDLYIEGDDVFYFKDYKNHNGNYYKFNGKPKRIMSDVGRVIYVKDNYMYVLKDYSSKTAKYDLYRYKDKKLELIDYNIDTFNNP